MRHAVRKTSVVASREATNTIRRTRITIQNVVFNQVLLQLGIEFLLADATFTKKTTVGGKSVEKALRRSRTTRNLRTRSRSVSCQSRQLTLKELTIEKYLIQQGAVTTHQLGGCRNSTRNGAADASIAIF